MLRHQTRPKSQPPIQLSGSAQTNNNSSKNNDIKHENQQEDLIFHKSASNKLALIESSSSLSLSSSSSSSAGSLASSSLSISTNSSTSTVLAALSHLQHQTQSQVQVPPTRAKSMIARYAASSSPAQTGGQSALHHRHSLQHQVSTSEDENDSIESVNQLSSSSSSSSDSSGLSSMISSSAAGSSTANEPSTVERAVERCLSDLVGSVALAEQVEVVGSTSPSPSSSADDYQGSNSSDYQAFQLYEAILAQTRSSTTTSGSSDEDNTAELAADSPGHCNRHVDSRLFLKSKLKFVQEFELERPLIGDSYAIFHSARQNLSDCLQANPSRPSNYLWSAGVNEHELAIEWQRDNQQVNRVYFTQLLECYVDQRLIVWVLDRGNPSPSELGASSNRLLVVSEPRQSIELETTLDDIALALDEPIEAGHPGKIERQQVGSCNVVALVWLCSSESEAKQLSDTYKSLRYNMNVEATGDIVALEKVRAADKEEVCLDSATPSGGSTGKQVKYLLDDDEIEMANKEDQLAALRRRLRQATGKSMGITNGLVSDAASCKAANHNKHQARATSAEQQVGRQAKSASAVNHQLTGGAKRQLTAATTSGNDSTAQPEKPLVAASETPASSASTSDTTAAATTKNPAAKSADIGDHHRRRLRSGSSAKNDEPAETNETHDSKTSKRRSAANLTLAANVTPTSTSAAHKLGLKGSSKSRLKKSVSGLDLSQSVAASPAPALSLAAYYRSVASRMLSNSSSKIRSLRDEMIKSNNRAPSATSGNLAPPSSSNKRVSMLLAGGSTCDLSTIQPVDSADDQQLQSPATPSAANRAKVDQVVPTVKPRTSILKNKSRQVNDGRDVDANNNSKRNSVNGHQQSACTKRNSTVGNLDSTGKQLVGSRESLASTRPTKSILKNSKSMPSIPKAANGGGRSGKLEADDENSSNFEAGDFADNCASVHEKRQTPSASRTSDNGSDRGAMSSTLTRTHAKDYEQRRRSTYSLASVERPKMVKDNVEYRGQSKATCIDVELADTNHVDLEEAKLAREQAFERLRQRASCYDITRLMSKNGLHNQLSKLRAGSTASMAAAKSRQRRPALLLDDSKPMGSKTLDHAETAPEMNNNSISPGQIVKVSGSSSPQKTYSSDLDGTVRAKVSAAQLKSSVADIDWSASSKLERESKVCERREQADSVIIGRKSAPTDQPGDRCEFDPRSLRKSSLVAAANTNSSQSSQGSEASSARRKSMTSDRPTKREEGVEQAKDQQVVQPKVSDRPQAEPALKTILKQRQPAAKPADTVIASSSGSSNDEADEGDETEKEDDEEDEETETPSSDEEVSESKSTRESADRPKAQKSPLGKSGAFNLLRQSFNQKTLSSMLRFSSRASLRVKSGPAASGEVVEAPGDKSGAIAAAEANLVAAKQLKLQASKLKEQQKREQQHMQVQMHHQHQMSQQQQLHHHQMPMAVDAATSMMLAAQYNQQQQYQRQQQQQMLYAQQYAVAARSHMFDATSVHMQHQLLIQRHHHQQHQQHQLYMANYMAQQMVPMGALAPPTPTPNAMYLQPSVPAPMVAAPPPSVGLAPGPQVAQPPSSSGFFRRSILKGNSSGKQQQAMYAAAAAAAQQVGGQQLIPMSVNHHSSFNIVYAGPSSTATGNQSFQQQQHHHQQHVASHQDAQRSQSRAGGLPAAKSSLGASMRKTVKSILINRSPFNSNGSSSSVVSGQSNGETSDSSMGQKTSGTEGQKLKSALKSGASVRELVLDSEGSDGDGSSSDSTVTNSVETPPNHHHQKPVAPKSALKKPPSSSQQQKNPSPTTTLSSDSSYCPSTVEVAPTRDSFDKRPQSQCYEKAKCSSLSRNMAYRQSVRASDSDLRASKRRITNSAGRKNVTFSTKLTSIL